MKHYVIWLSGGSNPLKGDLLVIAGSILYAVSNVSEVGVAFFFFFGCLTFHSIIVFYG